MGSTFLRATLICSFLCMGISSFGEEPIHHESKMVPVQWKSAVDSAKESTDPKDDTNLYKVAKPAVSESDEQPLVYRVYQAPSVYNQPSPPTSDNKFIKGFEQAGQDIGQATSQSVHDLGHGVQDAAQGALDGTRDFLSATGKTLGDVADNTINIGNEEYWQRKQQEDAAARNNGVVPPTSFNAPMNANNASVQPSSGYNNSGYNNSGFNTQPNNYAAQPQTNPSVPRVDNGIATNFSNSNNNNRFMHESRMQTVQGQNNQQAPPLQPANTSYQGNNGNGQYAMQGNNPSGFANPNAPLLTPPSNNQFNSNPNWPDQQVSTVSNRQPTQGNNQQFNNRIQPATTTTTVAATNSNTPGGTDGWVERSNNSDVSRLADQQTNKGPDPLANMGMLVVLAASLAGNIYGWTTCLDLRNKYRASLRRQPGSYQS